MLYVVPSCAVSFYLIRSIQTNIFNERRLKSRCENGLIIIFFVKKIKAHILINKKSPPFFQGCLIKRCRRLLDKSCGKWYVKQCLIMKVFMILGNFAQHKNYSKHFYCHCGNVTTATWAVLTLSLEILTLSLEMCLVAQLVRAPAWKMGGCGIWPRRYASFCRNNLCFKKSHYNFHYLLIKFVILVIFVFDTKFCSEINAHIVLTKKTSFL